jgi:hypothetical protein
MKTALCWEQTRKGEGRILTNHKYWLLQVEFFYLFDGFFDVLLD